MQTVAVWLGAALLVALPLRAFVRLRLRGRADLAPTRRLLYALLAAAITVGALLYLDGAADSLLAAHMFQHALIGDLVPLLVVLSVRGPMLFHLLPVPILHGLRRLRLRRLLGAIARPLPAFLIWAGSLAVWHLPTLYDGALENEQLHAFEHLTFLAGGLLVWSVLLDPARRGLLPGWPRFGYALALLAASAALSNTLILSYRPLYPSYSAPEDRPLALTPLEDQDLAGVLMMIEQLATVGTFALLSARGQLRLVPRAPQPGRHPFTA